MPKALVLDNVSKSYVQGAESLLVLKAISLHFDARNSYAITGASGSGKSTLLHILGGLDAPTSGQVRMQNLQRSDLGFVFQFHYLIRELSVLENVALAGRIAGIDAALARKQAGDLLGELGLHARMHAYPHELSGGEQQRVAIARALFNKPSFILADEPTGNLDAAHAQIVTQLFLNARQEWGMGLVICTHDPAVYGKMETVYEVRDGQVFLQTSEK